MPLMSVAVELVYHCFSFSRGQAFIKDGEDSQLRRQELKVPLPFFKGRVDHRQRHLLPYASQILDLLQKVQGSTAIN